MCERYGSALLESQEKLTQMAIDDIYEENEIPKQTPKECAEFSNLYELWSQESEPRARRPHMNQKSIAYGIAHWLRMASDAKVVSLTQHLDFCSRSFVASTSAKHFQRERN
ncbi:hypothetical protein KIN20_033535 [Parelaphostrongylus tenuis]|uniref:Uncharacterized protein n=1 Tax=Parelaphostrongylus tenuis TaxID=148309 RepID=A0AAD5R8U5_PARTN|nr:hypothetical protein KIN20_033535 [Parelaphostrongylus tenuis]